MNGQSIDTTNQRKRFNLLQAEGQLNRQIQLSLQSFRQKLTTNIQLCIPQGDVRKYETAKQGPQKTFQFRESLLSLMFKIKDFKTLYNMVIASFIILTFTLLLSNYQQKGEWINHEELFFFFQGFQHVIVYWLGLVLVHYTIVPITKFCIKNPSKYIWMPLYLLHQCLLMGLAIWVSQNVKLGFASVMIIMVEGTRMVMKSHSYFRTKMLYLTENQYKNYDIKGYTATNQKSALKHQQHVQKSQKSQKSPSIKQKHNTQKQQQQKQQQNAPSQPKPVYVEIHNNDIFTELKNFSYFFVAPTIIYRDRYTLTPIRNMSIILTNALNFLACIYYSFMLYVLICKPAIEKLETRLDLATFALTVIKLMLPSTFFLILGFFGFLHSWLNCWAEITRFPDRCFYSDWWNSIEFGSYYRKWNIIVHDWLYYFIFVDTCRFSKCGLKNTFMPKMLTFIISAVIHELIITYALGFFYPILFILFTGPGIILIQNQKNLKKISVNLAFWLEMYIGGSLLFTFYLVESFARKRISDEFIMSQWGSVGYFVPRTIYLGQDV